MSAPDPNVYRDAATPPGAAPWNPRAVRALWWSLGGIAMTVGGFGVVIALNTNGSTAVGAVLFVIALVGLVMSVVGARGGVRALGEVPAWPQPERGRGAAVGGVAFGVIGALFGVFGMFLAWLSTLSFSRGRQLRRRGHVLLPRVVSGADWTTQPLDVAVPPSERSGLAAQWRENGRTEHASVGAFARLTLDLMGLGAPPELLAAAQRDALDEIRHAELCFSLARALDGRDESPGAFAEAATARTLPAARSLALATLAVDSLVDGALNEGVSARIVARLAKVCESAEIRAVLKEIAADEGRHCAHGWDVVAWCLDEGGAPVAHALRGALDGLPAAMHTPLPEAARDGAWTRWGIHGDALEAEEFAAARDDLRARVLRMTDASTRQAA